MSVPPNAGSGVTQTSARRPSAVGRADGAPTGDGPAIQSDDPLFRKVFEAAPTALILSDATGRITQVNKRAELLFGYARADFAGMQIEELVPEALRAAHVQHRTAFFKAPSERMMSVRDDLQGRHKDGRLIPIEVGLSPVKTADGVQVISAIVDISQWRESESALRRSEARFRQVFETAPNALIMSDPSGTITMVNGTTEKLFGYAREELVGQSIDILVPDSMRSAHAVQRSTYCSSPAVRRMSERDDLVGRHKDGRQIQLSIGLSPVDTEDGVQILSAVVDISRRKAAEEALKREAAELAQRNKELDEFTYLASHDLQEPLRKLISFSDLLRQDIGGDLSEHAATDIDVISRSAQRMRTLVQDLLALSRSGKSEMKRARVPLDRLVEDALDALSVQIDSTGAVVTRDPLPEIEVDKTLITQVYQNLIGNALKFAAPDRNPAVHLAAEETDEGVRLSVIDNGIGIASEYSEKVFAPFKRLHSRSQKEGSGVGLSICRRAVERHGGRIWVESKEGTGSRFIFVLPQGKDALCKET